MIFGLYNLTDLFVYRKKLKKLQNEYYNCREQYDEPLREAYENNKDVFRRLLNERDGACEDYEIELKKYISNHLLQKARLYYAPTPGYDKPEMWEERYISHYHILSENGLSEVDSAILKKKKERMQIWISLISVITGLIGVLIALFSLILK